jgi:hypothetical protein
MLTYLDERLRLLRLHMGADGADALETMIREVDAYADATDETLATAATFAGSEAIVTLTTGQVKLLNTTPVTLVAAPGAGKALILDEATLLLDYVEPKYDGIAEGEDLNIRYTNGSGVLVATVEATGFMDQEADTLRHVKAASAADFAPVANAALVLFMATGNIATGSSILKVRVRYHVVDTAF